MSLFCCQSLFLTSNPIVRQVQSHTSGDTQYKGVWRSLVRIWNEEGFPGFMRGNGINCLRIVPYSAVQFTTYESLKKVSIPIPVGTRSEVFQWFSQNGQKELTTPVRLLAGALAGIASVCEYRFLCQVAYSNQFKATTYPLDLVRARLSIASASLALQISKKSDGM